MPSISLAVSLRGQLLSGTRSVAPAFSPSTLFASNEPGVWYDPSDISTLFTDTAGTTPVTTPGQTVALMLDKSKGLTLGAELVTNGDFASGTTGWTSGTTYTASLSAASGALELTSNSGNGFGCAIQSVSLVTGKTYKLTGTRRSISGGNPAVGFGNAAGVIQRILIAGSASTTTNSFSAVFVHTGDLFTLYNASSANGAVSEFDNISIRELPGNHAVQATAASRPTYGVVPLGGRRNLLTWSEGIDDAIWVKTRSTVSPNAAVAPDGTTTADKQIPNAVSGTHYTGQSVSKASSSQTITASVYVKADGYSFGNFGITGSNTSNQVNASFNLVDGTIAVPSAIGTGFTALSSSITALSDSWYRIAVSLITDASTATQTVLRVDSAFNTATYTGNGTSGLLMWGAQLETGSTATAYQRVTNAFDVTEAGVQSLSYLSFDGVDDGMVTGTITPGIDRAQVFAGVRKLSDAAGAVLIELSTTVSNNGALHIQAPDGTARYIYRTKGTILTSAATTSAAFDAPITNVLSGLSDISGDLVTLRINGTQVAQAAFDQGTGNYLAYPLYLGRRGGSSLPFNGQIYSLITRFGANLASTTINSTEYWVGDKTGINIANNISTTIFARDDTAVLDRANSIIERRA